MAVVSELLLPSDVAATYDEDPPAWVAEHVPDEHKATEPSTRSADASTRREQVRAAMQAHMPDLLKFCDEWKEFDPGMRIVYLDIPAAGIHMEAKDYVPPPEDSGAAKPDCAPPVDPIEMQYRLKHWKR